MNVRKQGAGNGEQGGRPRAFTLVEMLVSLAVIVVALAVVVTAFTITTRTARQAAAFAELQGWVRQFAAQIQEDLRHCDPSQSILVIHGRVQVAALTADDLVAQRHLRFLVGNRADVPPNYDPVFSAGLDPTSEFSDPRADIIMFFSNRPTVSQAPARDSGNASTSDVQKAIAAGARLAPVQIVYGHAGRGEVQRQPGGTYNWTNAVTNIEDTGLGGFSVIPAGTWHLARRVAILAPEPGTTYVDFGDMTRLVRCEPTDFLAGDTVDFSLTAFLTAQNDILITNPGDTAAYDANGNDRLYSDYLQGSIDPVLYLNPNKHHFATVLDSPPVDLRSNLGVHMLPGCAWFQVEFLMPEDARNSLDYDPAPASEGPPPPPVTQRNQIPRWTRVDDGETYVFLPDTPENRVRVADARSGDFSRVNPNIADPGYPANLADKRIRLWPYAIRITVRAYDPRGRLNEPILRTIVHRFE